MWCSIKAVTVSPRRVMSSAMRWLLPCVLSSTAAAQADVHADDVSSRLSNTLQQYVDAGREIDVVAFAPNGAWFVAADDYRYYGSVSTFDANGVRDKVESWRRRGRHPDALAFTADGEWVLTSGSWRYYSSGSRFDRIGLRPAIEALRAQGRTVDAVGIASNDAWVVLSDGEAIVPPPGRPQLPDKLDKALEDARAAGRYIHHVAVQGDAWVVLADNWAVSSDDFEGRAWLHLYGEGHRFIDHVALAPSGGWSMVVSEADASPLSFATSSQRLAAAFERDLRDRSAQGPNDPRYEILGEMKYHEVPGLQIALIEHGRVQWSRGYGVREAGTSDPVWTTTTFPAASMSKAVAAATVLSLAEDGVVGLDEPLNWFVSDHPGTDFHGFYQAENQQSSWAAWNPTLSDLLTHTGGLDTHGIGQYPLHAQPSTQTLLSWVDGIYNPGTAYRYSGGGYTLAEAVVEAVTGEDFADVAWDHVFAPLGMQSSTFEVPDEDILDDYALGHAGWNEPLDARACPGKAAGGLLTTAEDYGQFVSALMNRGMHDGQHVLEPLSVARMLQPVVVDVRSTSCTRNDQCDMAQGWFCDLSPSTSSTPSLFQRLGQCAQAPQDLESTSARPFRRYGLGVSLSTGSATSRGTDANGWPWRFSHGGTQEGYRSYFYASGSPHRDIGLVILTNGTCQVSRDGVCLRGSDALVDELVASFRRTYGW